MAYNVFAVSVDFYDEQQNNGSIVGMRIRVNNDSGAPITDAKLRYYFHRSSSQYAVDGYYLAGATMSVNDMNDGLAYIELDIPSIPQGYFPDLAGFSLALHHADWSPWEKGFRLQLHRRIGLYGKFGNRAAFRRRGCLRGTTGFGVPAQTKQVDVLGNKVF